MNLLEVALVALRAAACSISNTFREHGVASHNVGLSIQGRTVMNVIRQINVKGCPETLIIAKFDDGFYGVVAERDGRLRYLN